MGDMSPHISIDRDAVSAFCQRHHITRLALFGSVLRDDFGPDSDVDVLVEFQAGHVPGFKFVSIEREFSGLLHGRRVDMVTPQFLNRRIRALGPLVLVFMILGVTGASFIITLTGNNPKLLKAVSDFSYSIGLGATGTMVALHLIGFAAFAVLGSIILGLLRGLYEKKFVSEQSITVDAMWLLFGVVNSIGLVFEGRLWIFSGLAAFTLYKLVAAGLFRALGIARRAKSSGHRLLLLRVFALGKRSESLYDTLGKSWRTVGSMQMLAGPDLATSTIEPHEFLDFVSGKLDRRFIDSGRTLDLRIGQMDLEPDGGGQFRVTEFFCHDDTWKLTLARLADDSDAVLMDLRGFSQQNAGCVFEINEIFNLVPLQRVVFVVDETTDHSFMRQTMQREIGRAHV